MCQRRSRGTCAVYVRVQDDAFDGANTDDICVIVRGTK